MGPSEPGIITQSLTRAVAASDGTLTPLGPWQGAGACLNPSIDTGFNSSVSGFFLA